MTLNLVQAWSRARSRLEAAGLPGPVIDARLLVEAAAGAIRADIVGDPYRPLTEAQVATLDDYLARRERREPVSHILGRKGFWKIMLGVTADVLTPRPDTETLVEYVLRDFPEHAPWSVLDLGVGSGAILLAILSERPAAKGLGVDVSEEALAVARENAANLGLGGRVALLRGDWAAGLGDEGFDLVVANPPYIAEAVIETLEPEVRDHEPRLALSGGPDGLDAYRALIPAAVARLADRQPAALLLEIGAWQGADVTALARASFPTATISLHQDLAGRDRIVEVIINDQ